MITVVSIAVVIVGLGVGITIGAITYTLAPMDPWPTLLPGRVVTLARWSDERPDVHILRELWQLVTWWVSEVTCPLEPLDSFRVWWEETEVNRRKRLHHGRHRRSNAWRRRWASYDTQWWPTLSTSGHAEDLITEGEHTFGEWDQLLTQNFALAAIT